MPSPARAKKLHTYLELNEHEKVLALTLSEMNCTLCVGRGWITLTLNNSLSNLLRKERLCDCVYRKAWRICFFYAKTLKNFTGTIVKVRGSYAYPLQNYSADLTLAVNAKLPEQYLAVLQLSGLNWRDGTKKLKIKKSEWFYRLYKAESMAGRVVLSGKPCLLFPMWEYFK